MERDQRGDLLLQQQDAVAEALVVVDEVEVADSRGDGAQGPEAERQRFGERPGRELQHLEQVLAGLELPVRREAAGVVVIEQVEAR
jgi:hypothetical protein